jgi:hypothetical protein
MITNKLIKENSKNKINSNYNRLAGTNAEGYFKLNYTRIYFQITNLVKTNIAIW